MSRGRLFDSVADDYDDVRPTYPDEVYDAIERLMPLAGAHVLELAAGTGVATRQLQDRGADVVAVEPGVPMIQRLRGRSPSAAAVAARAEQLPFRGATFDLACCATAWHWLDAGQVVTQLRHVVRGGGYVALWWANHRHDEAIDWEAAQDAVYARWQLRPGSRPPTDAGVSPRDASADLRRRGLDVVVDTELTWSRTVSRAQHLRVLGTHSVVLDLGERRQQLLAEVEQALAPWDTVEERLWGPLVIARIPS